MDSYSTLLPKPLLHSIPKLAVLQGGYWTGMTYCQWLTVSSSKLMLSGTQWADRYLTAELKWHHCFIILSLYLACLGWKCMDCKVQRRRPWNETWSYVVETGCWSVRPENWRNSCSIVWTLANRSQLMTVNSTYKDREWVSEWIKVFLAQARLGSPG